MNVLDTTLAYETPEGVELDLRLAGPLVRACAWWIDTGIRAVIYVIIAYVFSLLGGVGMAMMLIGFFLLEWFYPVFFEIRSGQTPGKKAMGIHVVNDNGTPVTWSASLLRNLLRSVDFLPFMYCIGLISMLVNREFRRLGDLVAGTLVTYKDSVEQRSELPPAEAVAPPQGLDIDEHLLLLLFAERSHTFSNERRIELANQLHEITGLSGEAAVRTLWGHAHWLAEGK